MYVKATWAFLAHWCLDRPPICLFSHKFWICNNIILQTRCTSSAPLSHDAMEKVDWNLSSCLSADNEDTVCSRCSNVSWLVDTLTRCSRITSNDMPHWVLVCSTKEMHLSCLSLLMQKYSKGLHSSLSYPSVVTVSPGISTSYICYQEVTIGVDWIKNALNLIDLCLRLKVNEFLLLYFYELLKLSLITLKSHFESLWGYA